MDNFLYSNELIPSSGSLLYTVNRAGCGDLGSDFHISRNRLYPYSVIHYVVKGSGFVVWKGKKYDFHEGQLFVLNPYESHEYGINNGDCLAFNWIEFFGGDSERIMSHIINNSSPVIAAPCCKIANKYIKRILALLQVDKEASAIISRLIYAILTSILDFTAADSNAVNAEFRYSNLIKAIDYIDSNLHKDLNIKKLASLCSYSPTYFSKLFFKAFGISPSQYIIRKRITKGKELLINSTIPVEILAESLGFCSPSHFIRSFRSCEGVTPAEYRRQNLLLGGKR